MVLRDELPPLCHTFKSSFFSINYKLPNLQVLCFNNDTTVPGVGGTPLPSSSGVPYTLPSSVCSKSFVCHSYENWRGVVGFFPFWNSKLPVLGSGDPDRVGTLSYAGDSTRQEGRLSSPTLPFQLSTVDRRSRSYRDCQLPVQSLRFHPGEK